MIAKPRLQSLIFEVTQRCNHACLYCYNVWKAPPASLSSLYHRGQLDTEQTLKLLARALDQTDCQHITLTGGEPLLRKDLPTLLEFLQVRRIQVTIISNGRLLEEGTAAMLLDRGVGLFELPLLSHRRNAHDSLSGAPGAWDAVLDAMANIRIHQGSFVAAFVGTRLNIAHLHETIRLAFAFGARALMFNRFNPGGRGISNFQELLPSVEQVREALQVAEAAALEFGLPISCSIPIQPCLIDTRLFPHLNFSYCAVGGEHAYYTLDPLGNVRPCNHSPVILGNLLEESFSAMIASERLEAFKKALPLSCQDCTLRTSCQGGCKAAAPACYGSLSAEEPFLREHREECTIQLPT